METNTSGGEQGAEAHKLWGFPETKEDIGKLFASFCRGELAALPWSDEAPAAETSVISSHLAKLNELGFLTINSQPAVNGIRSNDKVHGWGPGNGFVYQKVGHSPFISQLSGN
jgi:methylenetetrahydrofolate reductase (NADPH)